MRPPPQPNPRPSASTRPWSRPSWPPTCSHLVRRIATRLECTERSHGGLRRPGHPGIHAISTMLDVTYEDAPPVRFTAPFTILHGQGAATRQLDAELTA